MNKQFEVVLAVLIIACIIAIVRRHLSRQKIYRRDVALVAFRRGHSITEKDSRNSKKNDIDETTNVHTHKSNMIQLRWKLSTYNTIAILYYEPTTPLNDNLRSFDSFEIRIKATRKIGRYKILNYKDFEDSNRFLLYHRQINKKNRIFSFSSEFEVKRRDGVWCGITEHLYNKKIKKMICF